MVRPGILTVLPSGSHSAAKKPITATYWTIAFVPPPELLTIATNTAYIEDGVLHVTELTAEPFGVPTIFRDPLADLPFISRDSYNFRAFESILISGSTFFRSMFCHPQPASVAIDELLRWDEAASTIVFLLYYLSPVPKRAFDSVDQALVVARATDKWGMDYVLSVIREKLLEPRFFNTRPYAVYKLASDIGDEALEEAATKRLIENHDPLDPSILHDLRGFDALELAQLIKKRDLRIRTAQRIVEESFPGKCPHGLDYSNSRNVEELKNFLIRKLSYRPTLDWSLDWSTFVDDWRSRSSEYGECNFCGDFQLGFLLEGLDTKLRTPS